MIRPTRLSIAVGGEHLLPVAKHALLMLRTQMERLKVPTLSQILNVGDGRIEIVANAFGIDSINIAWQGVEPHGIMCWPASDDAIDGWGKPFSDANGNSINPPLGTKLSNPDTSKNLKREVLFHKNWKDKDETHTDLLLKRRLSKQNPKDMGRNSKWISKERGIVLITDGDVIYNRLVVVATAPDDETIKVAGVFTGKDSAGKDKRYFWIVTIYRLITDPVNDLGDTVFRSYRAPYRKGSMPKDEATGETKKTEWEKLDEWNFTRDGNNLYKGEPNYEIQIGRVVLNESCNEIMVLYSDRDFKSADPVTYQKKRDISGYTVLSRDLFVPEDHRNIDTMQRSFSSGVLGDKDSKEYGLTGVPESFVFDVGYRGDTPIFAEYINVSARLEHINGINRSDAQYSVSIDDPRYGDPEYLLGHKLVNGTRAFRVDRSIDMRMGDFVLPLERTVNQAQGRVDYSGSYGTVPCGAAYRYVDPYPYRDKTCTQTLSFMRRHILYANPSDGVILYSELTFEGTGTKTGHKIGEPFGTPCAVSGYWLFGINTRSVDTVERIKIRNVMVVDGVEHELYEQTEHDWSRHGTITERPTPNDFGGFNLTQPFVYIENEKLSYYDGYIPLENGIWLGAGHYIGLNELFAHIDIGDVCGYPAVADINYIGDPFYTSLQPIYDQIHADPFQYKSNPELTTFLPHLFETYGSDGDDRHRTGYTISQQNDNGPQYAPQVGYLPLIVRFNIPTYLYPTPGILPDYTYREDGFFPLWGILNLMGYREHNEAETIRSQIQIPEYAYFPITDERGVHLFSVKPNDGRILGGYNDVSWKNYLTDNDPVELSKVTGPNPRFNDITVF